jgi:RNA polymerase sigma factor (sigma-70 family)
MTRDERILACAYLVPLTRRRLYPVPPRGVAPEDLDGAGYLGLVKAADRYDPARGVAFKSWAINWIRGAMREYLREDDWLSRREREEVNAGRMEEPLVVSLEEVLALEQGEWDRHRLESIPDPAPGPEEEVCEQGERESIRRIVARLPRRERQVVWRTEGLGESSEQVGRRLGLSESRVWQLRNQGRRRLRRFLGGAGSAG